MLLLKPVNLFPKRRGTLLVFLWNGAPACARVITVRCSDGSAAVLSVRNCPPENPMAIAGYWRWRAFLEYASDVREVVNHCGRTRRTTGAALRRLLSQLAGGAASARG